MLTNKSIIGKNAIDTRSLTSGHLNAEQSKMFIKMMFESTNLSPLIRHEIRRSRIGEIDKIGIAKRLIREKKEDTDDGYRVTAITSQVDYKTTAVRIPWEITEDAIRENYTPDELAAISSGYAMLIDESSDVLQDLKNVVNVTGMSLSDAERLAIIDNAYRSLMNYRNLVRYYTGKTISVSYLRARKKNDMDRVMSLYGTANERYW